MRQLSFLVAFFALLVPLASAQGVADSLRGAPHQILAEDLPATYRAIAFGSTDGGLGGMSIYALAGMGNSGDPQTSLFFSLVGSTFVDPDEFAELLEGKRPRIRGYTVDFTSMVTESSQNTDRSRVPIPRFSETWIEGGRILQWTPRPALTKDVIVKTFGTPKAPGASENEQVKGLSNVKQLALATIMYAGDSDDVFPNAESTAQAQPLVAPYTKNNSLWTGPNGGRVLYNTALSRIPATAVEFPSETVLIWEEKPYPDGSRAVAYADGHARRLTEEEWHALWNSELRRRTKFRMDATARNLAAANAKKKKIKRH